MKKINPDDIIPLSAFEELDCYPVYTEPARDSGSLTNKFPGLYHPGAEIIWAHKEVASITVLAARICAKLYNWKLCVVDCLRPVEAQEKMKKYNYDPSLVSLPGTGGHPRAMAIDIVPIQLQNPSSKWVDMGVPFDHFSSNPEVFNPSARDHTGFECGLGFSSRYFLNRQKLEFAMLAAADLLETEIWPLDQEWWDFRLPADRYNAYYPLSEEDVYPVQRLINPDLPAISRVINGDYQSSMHQTIEQTRKIVNAVSQELQ